MTTKQLYYVVVEASGDATVPVLAGSKEEAQDLACTEAGDLIEVDYSAFVFKTLQSPRELPKYELYSEPIGSEQTALELFTKLAVEVASALRLPDPRQLDMWDANAAQEKASLADHLVYAYGAAAKRVLSDDSVWEDVAEFYDLHTNAELQERLAELTNSGGTDQ